MLAPAMPGGAYHPIGPLGRSFRFDSPKSGSPTMYPSISPTSRRKPSLLARTALITVILSAGSFAWTATGTVKTSSGAALAGVSVSVKDSSAGMATTTNVSGAFAVNSTTSIGSRLDRSSAFRRDGRDLVIQLPGEGLLEISLVDLSGSTLWRTHAALVQGSARVTIPTTAEASTGILSIRSGSEVLSRTTILRGAYGWTAASPSLQAIAARSAAVFPTLLLKKAGFRDTAFAMTSESMSGIAMTMTDTIKSPAPTDFVEDNRAACTIPALPAASGLPSIAALPDPFKKIDGTRMAKKSEWTCRREEIAAQLEKYVYGEKPRNPEKVVGSMSGNTLTVSVTDKGKTVSFTVAISKPTGTGPFAAVIGYGGGNLGNSYSSLPVATINYAPFTLASEGSGRGKGVFYDLYGSNHAASELMAQAWGVSRIIDALATTPAAGIDPRKIAVTGCSRYGKGATVAGAFDQRIKVTIPQESGSGGVSAWRIVATLSDAQPIASTHDEAYWTRADFKSNFANAPGKLPIDNHQMAAIIAPNALLVVDNSIAWLGPKAGYGSAIAAKELFNALGVGEALTYTSVGGHTHCGLPTTQNHWVASYFKKYLLGQAGETAKIEAPSDYTFDRAKWINWTTPTLQ